MLSSSGQPRQPSVRLRLASWPEAKTLFASLQSPSTLPKSGQAACLAKSGRGSGAASVVATF